MNWYTCMLPEYPVTVQAQTKIHAPEILDELMQNYCQTISDQFYLAHQDKKIAPPVPSSSFKQVHSYSRGQGFPSHNKTDENDNQFLHGQKQPIYKIELTE